MAWPHGLARHWLEHTRPRLLFGVIGENRKTSGSRSVNRFVTPHSPTIPLLRIISSCCSTLGIRKLKIFNFPGKRRLSLCVGCGAQIHDQYILRVAPDLEWHAACLKCAECHQFLDETCTCFVRDGKTYCKRDYVRYV